MARMINIKSILLNLLAIIMVFTITSSVTFAQKQNNKAAKVSEKSKLKIPDGVTLKVIIHRTLLALNEANLTGNYTVFRDAASPGLRETVTSAKLAEIFSDLRGKNIDFSPLLLFNPVLSKKPEIGGDNLLRLTGFIPTKPLQLNFQMIFTNLDDTWMIHGIAVDAVKAPTKKNKPEKSKK
ncbi:MAG: hypothetical protein ACRBBN_15655 [Methyloligellaceae bacterium]